MRVRRSDLLLAGGLIAVTLVEHALAERPGPIWMLAIWLAAAASLAARRLAPRTIAAAVLVLYLARFEVALPGGPVVLQRLLWPLAVYGVVAYAATPRAAWREGVAVAALFAGAQPAGVAAGLLPDVSSAAHMLFLAAIPATGLAAGVALRDRSAELDTVRRALLAEETGGADRARVLVEAARERLATEVYAHVLSAIDRVGELAAQAADRLRAGGDAVPPLHEVQRLAAEAIERLKPILTVLRADAEAEARADEAARPAGGAVLDGLQRLAGPRAGGRVLSVSVHGAVPAHLGSAALLAGRAARDGVALFERHGRGELRLAIRASGAGVELELAGGGPWWRRGAGELERERLAEAVGVAGGSLRPPRPWRRRAEVEMPARPRAGRAGARRPPPLRAAGVLPLDATRRAALLPPLLLAAYALAEIPLVVTPAPAWLRVAGTLAAAAALVGRRRAPVACVAAVVAILLARQALGDLGSPTFAQNLFFYFAAFTAGAHARGPASVLGGVVVVGGGVAGALAEPFDYAVVAHALFATVLATAWIVGWSVRRLVDAADLLREARAALVARRRAEVAAALREDRLALARELHDVVGHSLTVVAVQAGAAAAHAGRDRDAALEAVAVVRDYLLAARTELAQLVRALGPAEPAGGPSRADLERLVDRSRRAGLPVALELAAGLDAAPAPVRAAAFRIVQEALTNVRRHAGHPPTRISVDLRGEALQIRVHNGAGRAAGPRGLGAGVEGMRERAAALGGTVDAAPTTDGGFEVSARLPLARHPT